MPESPGVTCVIPAKDEAPMIAEIISGCQAADATVIVVDGHSKDRTREIALEAGAQVLQDGGKGKGDAIRGVVSVIDTEIVVFIDADGSHDPENIPELIEPILRDEADHVTGSRLIGGSSELHGGFDEFFRLSGSSFITACINWRFGVRLSDSQNGFRAIRTDVLRQLDLRENTTTIEQEMIMKTLRKGYRMGEIPAHEYARRFGDSHIQLWRASHRYVYSLVKNLFF